ncbi:MAG: hypothetical protein RLZZ210_924, partial [Pseudomonadota bacterium]
PAAKMFFDAFISALSMCPQDLHSKCACDFLLPFSICPHLLFFGAIDLIFLKQILLNFLQEFLQYCYI